MRKIFKIARLELSILFYSPVAWLVLAIFMVQCGITFLENLQSIRTTLSLGYQTRPITWSLFAGSNGLFTAMQGYIYLYLPILTMGLMSRETSSGSIKLLLSSPVKLRQIILGKFFAIIGYGLTLILALGVFAVIGSLLIKDVDLGLIFSGLLAIYLLICTYAAIGLFMSCLTNYQVVAAISTLAVFAVMRYVGTIGQDIDFVRDLTFFLSINGRTDKMINGMITTKDLFYYLVIIASFLSLCVLRLKSERELKPWSVKAARYVALIVLALLIGYVTSRPRFTGYLDATSRKSLTITKTSQDIAAKFTKPLKVTTYVNMLAPNVWYTLPQSRNNDLSKLEQFVRFIPGMDINYVYYYQKPTEESYQDFRFNPNLKGITNVDQIAEKMATTMGINGDIFIKPAEINKQVNLGPEGYLIVRKLEYEGRSTFLRFYFGDTDPYAGEAEISAALKRLLVKEAKAVFLSGNNERSVDSKADRDYLLISTLKTRRRALVNQGFSVEDININTQEIPADADVVVLADPTMPFSPIAQQKIAAYINKGGNMVIAGEPGRQQILNPVLQQLGVRLKSGILVKPDKELSPGVLVTQLSKNVSSIDSNLARIQKRDLGIPLQGAAAIEYVSNGTFKIDPLLTSAEGGWNKMFSETALSDEPALKAPVKAAAVSTMTMLSGGIVASGGVSNQPEAPIPAPKIGSIDLATADLSFNAATGDQKGTFPTAITLTRDMNGKQQKIVVSGDADFISNVELPRPRSRFNEDYLQGLFRWFGGGKFPIDVSRPPATDTDIKVSRGQITGLMWLCKAAIPALIAIMGAITLFRRRRN